MTETARPRKTAAAQRRTASAGTKKTLSIEYGGRSFTIPAVADFSLETLEAMEDNRPIATLRQVLGEKQYASMREVVRTNTELGEFYGLFLEVIQAGE